MRFVGCIGAITKSTYHSAVNIKGYSLVNIQLGYKH